MRKDSGSVSRKKGDYEGIAMHDLGPDGENDY